MLPLLSPGNLVHLHLLLNHVPTVGTVLAIGLAVAALARRNSDLAKVSFEAFVIVAILTLPAYVSGSAAEAVLNARSEASGGAIAAHRDAAMIAFALIELTGLVGWFGLWQLQRTRRPSRRMLIAVGVLALVALAAATRTATLGGAIGHPEILAEGASQAGSQGGGWLNSAAMGEYIISHLWIWPTMETLHFIGMSLSFGVLLLVNGYLLGFIRSASPSTVYALLPLGMAGVGLNLITGMLFFTGVSSQYTENPTFYFKVLFLVLAGLNYLYLTGLDFGAAGAPGGRRPLGVRFVALSSFVLWTGVLYFGRMLPYLRASL